MCLILNTEYTFAHTTDNATGTLKIETLHGVYIYRPCELHGCLLETQGGGKGEAK